MSETGVDLSELPDGWTWTTLGKIIEPSKEKVNPLEIEEVPYISLEHIEKDTGKPLGHGRSSDVKSSKTKFNRGDLLYGKLRPYLNKVYIETIRSAAWIEIVHIDEALDVEAWRLLAERLDKEWSLIDCASFVVMKERGLTEALTTDRHFEQAS